MHDLILTNGRVIDPAQNIDAPLDVAFANGQIAAIGHDLGPARETRDVTGKIVAPGLIDMHTHVYWGGTSLGVDPDQYAKPCGITTLIDAGSAGPGNIAGFRKHVIEPAEVRILPFLNISFAGIFSWAPGVNVGETSDLRLLNSRIALTVAKAQSDLVVGIKVRVGRGTSGETGMAAMSIAREVAQHAGLPVMAHLDDPPPSRGEVLGQLRAGDILTHCFRPFPNAPATADGTIEADVLAARARGVIFDIGHGAGSFGFASAMAMVGKGFLPDVISSDVHAQSIDGPAFDLLVTMSKFLHLGVAVPEILRAVTINAARAVRLDDRGTFRPGSLGDATVLEIAEGAFPLTDAVGQTVIGRQKFVCHGAVLGGRWWQ